ncbi:DUF7344 domain-containing protein [Natronorarus salvus]|uniref:DUF7344 domain-containing protein n=1 Tax=Natronorarus salvus TaxID=3117733 RepID=UPI002F26732E
MSTDTVSATDAGELQTPTTPTIRREDIFEVLSNDRRQQVLNYMKHREGESVQLRELVDHVAAWENDTTVERLDSSARKCVYTALRQSHLPKLDEYDIVEYDARRGEVELTEGAREVQMYLEYAPRNDVPWSHYYLGLSGVAALLTLVTWAGVGPFAGLAGLSLAGILVALFATSAVVHTYQSRMNLLGSEEALEP